MAPSSMRPVLLYRVVDHNGGVVFATRNRARIVARIHQAISRSRTWGQFRAAIPREEYSRVIRNTFDARGEARPRSTDAFIAEVLPGWVDGDYPPWLQQEMGRVIPPTILKQFGSREATAINGPFWLIPEANCDEICKALRSQGFDVRRAQRLAFY
jgi:hypothetical protein